MKFNELKTTTKSGKGKSRVGRGIAAGQGKTAGRGTKGYGSRTGSTRKQGFEGGQNPLMQRLPKLRGFKSQHLKPELVGLGDLKKIKGAVDNFSAYEAGIISSPHVVAKLIGNGKTEGKHDVSLQLGTKSAIEAITKAGGSFKPVGQVARTAKKPSEE
ncbi:50S ribosomal protein L15 [soil metagenome]